MNKWEYTELAEAARKKGRIAALELEMVQACCSHTGVLRKYKSNTGNYDPSQDCYWRECECITCGKKWTEEQ